MTCKDCLPVFYSESELPRDRASFCLVLKHVALCPLHAAASEMLEACKTVLSLFDRLEFELDPADPLRKIREDFHAPYREALFAAIEKAKAQS